MATARIFQTKGTLDPKRQELFDAFIARYRTNKGRATQAHAQHRGDGRTYGVSERMKRLPSAIRSQIMCDIDFDCSHPSTPIDCPRYSNRPIPPMLQRIARRMHEIRAELADWYNTT